MEALPGENSLFVRNEYRRKDSHVSREKLIYISISYSMRPGPQISDVPVIAIGAFGGLWTAELARLDLKEVHLDRNFIEVSAA
jgi:hypothetical protein